MQSEESDSSSSSTVDIPDSFKTPQIPNKWRPHTYSHNSNSLRHKPYAQKVSYFILITHSRSFLHAQINHY